MGSSTPPWRCAVSFEELEPVPFLLRLPALCGPHAPLGRVAILTALVYWNLSFVSFPIWKPSSFTDSLTLRGPTHTPPSRNPPPCRGCQEKLAFELATALARLLQDPAWTQLKLPGKPRRLSLVLFLCAMRALDFPTISHASQTVETMEPYPRLSILFRNRLPPQHANLYLVMKKLTSTL